MEAARFVVSIAGSVDGFLEHGGLDVSDCGRALEEATGCSVYDEDGWSMEKVQRLARETRWGDVEGRLWAVLSAKVFLDTCAKLGLGIRFSY